MEEALVSESTGRRPIGIAILSWLHIIGGGLGTILVLVLLPTVADMSAVSNALAAIGIPPALLAAGLAFLLVLTCASGVGMWLGRKWGWFLGGLYYMYSVALNVNALAMIPSLMGAMTAEELAQAAHGPAFYYAKHGIRAAVHAVLYAYLFRANVRAWFGLAGRKWWKPAAWQLGICLLIVASFSTAARITPGSMADESELLAVDALFLQGDYEAAMKKGAAYVDAHPASFKAWSQLGWAHLKLDHLEEARTCLGKAIELEPTWDNAYVGLGVLCRMQGDLDGARDNYGRALVLVPDNAQALSSLLVIELMEGNDGKAIEYGERAWAICRDDPTIAANLAIAYHYAGNVEKRGLFFNHARRLGYRNTAGLQDIFDGKTSIR